MTATVSTPDTRSDYPHGQPFPQPPVPDGLLHLPPLPTQLVLDAQRAITAWLGAGFPDPELDHLPHRERMRRYTYDSYGDRTLRESAPIQQVFAHYGDAVRKVVGADAWRHGIGVQIALRMPGESGIRHIDGIADGEPDDPRVPNAVLGVYLSNVGPDNGAFGVYPQLRDELRRYGACLQHDPRADDDRAEYDAIIDAQGQEIQPHVVTGSAGTVFLIHGGMPHCNLPNLGTGIRYALFARYYRYDTYPQGFDPCNDGRAWSILADPDRAWASTSNFTLRE